MTLPAYAHPLPTSFSECSFVVLAYPTQNIVCVCSLLSSIRIFCFRIWPLSLSVCWLKLSSSDSPVSTHSVSMASLEAPLLALGTSKYAVCRHGHDHRGWCGYAHKTGDIEFPHKFNWRMWICLAHEPRGHAGIDLFVGQVYTGAQYDHVIQMVHAETLPRTAKWARMFAWFLSLSMPLHDRDEHEAGPSKIAKSCVCFDVSWQTLECTIEP